MFNNLVANWSAKYSNFDPISLFMSHIVDNPPKTHDEWRQRILNNFEDQQSRDKLFALFSRYRDQKLERCYVYLTSFDGIFKVGISKAPGSRLSSLDNKLLETKLFYSRKEAEKYEQRMLWVVRPFVKPTKFSKQECFKTTFVPSFERLEKIELRLLTYLKKFKPGSDEVCSKKYFREVT